MYNNQFTSSTFCYRDHWPDACAFLLTNPSSSHLHLWLLAPMFLLTPNVFHDHRRQSSQRLPKHDYKRRSEQAGGFKRLISLTDSLDQPIDRPLWHTVTIAIIETLWEAEGTGVKGRHTIFLPFAGQRQGRDGKRRHALKDMRRRLRSAFTKHQLLFLIPLNNLHLE